jgi:AraC family cel operon transcriptional repressor
MTGRLKIKSFIPRGQYYHIATSHRTHDERPAPPPLHCHDFHELFWVVQGRCVHYINGEQRRLAAGTLVLVRAPDRHGFSVEPGETVGFTNIAFHRETWDYLCRRYFDSDKDVFRARPAAAREFSLSTAEYDSVEAAARELERRPRSRAAIEGFLLNLLYKHAEKPHGTVAQELPPWLAEACRTIGEGKNFQEGTPMFARLAHRSPEHVAREVRRHLGKTPTDIVNEARMAFAARRLSSSEDKIIDIASECGVENLSHFYRLFEQRYGTTPRNYRLQQRSITGA